MNAFSLDAKASNPATRDTYGALNLAACLTPAERSATETLLGRAVHAGLLPAPYAEPSRKEFECLNHHVYDALSEDGELQAVIVLALWYWKHLRKGHTRMVKTYYLVRNTGADTVAVTELDSRTCARRAKNALVVGQLARHYLGREHVKCATPQVTTSLGFKVVAKRPDGTFVSAFDESVYKLGVWRSEAALEDHGGGFYYYASKEMAVEATQAGRTFARNVSEGKELVLCEVEVAGCVIEYEGGKRAASRLRVLQELAAVHIEQ